MAIFESKFSVGDKIFQLEALVRWANGAAKSIKLHEVKVVETITGKGAETVVKYTTDQGGYMLESEVVAEKDARAIAIQHLSARLSAVASETLEAK